MMIYFLSYLLAINLLTFFVMLIDKLQAVSQSRRVRERTFYLLSFVGGSIGTIIAMYTIRHKSRKPSFQLMVWLVFLLQLCLGILFFREHLMPILLF